MPRRSHANASYSPSLSEPESETQFSPRDDDSQNMWSVVKILRERGNKYLVQWEGIDPDTGEDWAPSWVGKRDCTDDLIREWKMEKAAKKQRKKKSRTSTSKSATSRTKLATARSPSSERSSVSTEITHSRSRVSPANETRSPSTRRSLGRMPVPVVQIVTPKRKRDDQDAAYPRKRQAIEATPTLENEATESEVDSSEEIRIGPPRRKKKQRPIVRIPSDPGSDLPPDSPPIVFLPTKDCAIPPPIPSDEEDQLIENGLSGFSPARGPRMKRPSVTNTSKGTIIPDSQPKSVISTSSPSQRIHPAKGKPKVLKPVPRISPSDILDYLPPKSSQIEQFSSPIRATVQNALPPPARAKEKERKSWRQIVVPKSTGKSANREKDKQWARAINMGHMAAATTPVLEVAPTSKLKSPPKRSIRFADEEEELRSPNRTSIVEDSVEDETDQFGDDGTWQDDLNKYVDLAGGEEDQLVESGDETERPNKQATDSVVTSPLIELRKRGLHQSEPEEIIPPSDSFADFSEQPRESEQGADSQPTASEQDKHQARDPSPTVAQQGDSEMAESWRTNTRHDALQTTDSQPTGIQQAGKELSHPQDMDPGPRTDSQQADLQSTDLQALDPQASDSQLLGSQSTDSQSTSSRPTDSQSTDSQPTVSQPTDSQPMDLQPMSSSFPVEPSLQFDTNPVEPSPMTSGQAESSLAEPPSASSWDIHLQEATTVECQGQVTIAKSNQQETLRARSVEREVFRPIVPAQVDPTMGYKHLVTTSDRGIDATSHAEDDTTNALREEIIALTRSKETIQSDLDYLTLQYQEASNAASSLGHENAELTAQNSILQRQATLGVMQCQLTYETRIVKLEEELRKAQALVAVLQERGRLTDDEVRRKAASEPTLRILVEELQKEVDRLKGFEQDAKETAERLNKVNQDLIASEEKCRELEVQVAVYESKAKKTKNATHEIHFATNGNTNNHDDDMVFVCPWRVINTPCGVVLDSREALEEHLFSSGHLIA